MRKLLSASLAAALALTACSLMPDGTRNAAPVIPMPSAPIGEGEALTRIHFASCLKQADPMPILMTMRERKPDLAILLGDNVYGDVEDTGDRAMPELRSAYRTLAGREEFTAFRREVPLLTVWDDHDYGLNDRGSDFPLKEEAEEIFEDAWALPEDDERRGRPGVYTAKTFGPEGQRVQLILLDTRYFRDELIPTDERGAPGKERYLPDMRDDAQMLGAEQEVWLEETLKEPADLRILVSSVQVIAEGHGWEAWRTMPGARARLYGIIERSGAEDLVIVSGDRHMGALYRREGVLPFTLYEMTSSSLNAPASRWRARDGRTTHEPGPHRIGPPVYEENFGEIAIDWERRLLSMSLRGREGEARRLARVPFGPAEMAGL